MTNYESSHRLNKTSNHV